MAYDKNYKKRAIEYHEEGNTIRATTKVFGISPSTLNDWLNQYRNKAECKREKRIYQHKINEKDLLKYLDENSDAYLSEIAEYFNCCTSTAWNSLKRLNITRKKR